MVPCSTLPTISLSGTLYPPKKPSSQPEPLNCMPSLAWPSPWRGESEGERGEERGEGWMLQLGMGEAEPKAKKQSQGPGR